MSIAACAVIIKASADVKEISKSFPVYHAALHAEKSYKQSAKEVII